MNSEERQAIVNVVKDREPDNEASQSVVLDESNMMIISDVRGHEKGAPEEDSGRGSDDSSVSISALVPETNLQEGAGGGLGERERRQQREHLGPGARDQPAGGRRGGARGNDGHYAQRQGGDDDAKRNLDPDQDIVQDPFHQDADLQEDQRQGRVCLQEASRPPKELH